NGSGEGQRRSLEERLKGLGLPPLHEAWKQEIELPQQLSLPKLSVHSKERSGFQLAFLVRMLFSCLVDADFLDTEAFYQKIEKRPALRSIPVATLSELRDALDLYLSQFQAERPVDQV